MLNRGAHIHLFLHEQAEQQINSHSSKSGALQCCKGEERTLIQDSRKEKIDNTKLDYIGQSMNTLAPAESTAVDINNPNEKSSTVSTGL